MGCASCTSRKTGVLLAENLDGFCELSYEKLVLATGARERFLPFPGWTLPNVMGAGGLQAMVKCGLPIRGKRVIVAGTGPLLLAVAAYLRKHGAEIPVICEQASWSSLARFGLALFGWPAKIVQGLQLKRDLAGVPFAANSWPLAAHGQKTLESVTISRAGRVETIPCDYLACGFHLVPNIELPLLLGVRGRAMAACKSTIFRRRPSHRSSAPGEPTSIGGVELALIEGQIAGLAAAGTHQRSESIVRRAPEGAPLCAIAGSHVPPAFGTEELAFARNHGLPLRGCFLFASSRSTPRWRSAKLHTRCGMGPCQGRVCGPATQFLFKWKPDSVRPPVFPARVETLAAMARPVGNAAQRSNRRTLMNWKGVIPAITTSFTEDLRVDHSFVTKHCRWLLDNGCAGIVALGSLGEGATLSFDEKVEILRTCVSAVHGRGPVVASISALTTSEAVAMAKAAADLGCDALMVLAALCLSGQLAGNEDPRRHRVCGHSAFLHALQQSRRLRNRFPSRTDSRIGGGARKLRGCKGIEHRCPARICHSRAARPPPGDLGRR